MPPWPPLTSSACLLVFSFIAIGFSLPPDRLSAARSSASSQSMSSGRASQLSPRPNWRRSRHGGRSFASDVTGLGARRGAGARRLGQLFRPQAGYICRARDAERMNRAAKADNLGKQELGWPSARAAHGIWLQFARHIGSAEYASGRLSHAAKNIRDTRRRGERSQSEVRPRSIRIFIAGRRPASLRPSLAGGDGWARRVAISTRPMKHYCFRL